MISVAFAGGLGNQMFQIFTVLAHMFKHGYVLGLENKTNIDGFTTKRTVYWDSIFKNLKCFCNPSTTSLEIYREPAFHYIEIPKKDNIKLYGYYQSPKYFDEYKCHILALLGIKEMIESLRNTAVGRLAEGTIGMHFRYGDYVNNENFHCLLKGEYYVNALEHILMNDTVDTVTYICEDHDLERVESIIKLLKTHNPTVIFQRCKTIEDQDEMLLFSLCKHHVLANSTFGWWGAYLSCLTGTVCYPSTWFGPMGPRNTEDLFFNSWTKIDVKNE